MGPPCQFAAAQRIAPAEAALCAPKIRKEKLPMRAANRRVVDLNGQIIEAKVALQVFAGARMRFNGDDPSRPGNTHGGGQAQLARALVLHLHDMAR